MSKCRRILTIIILSVLSLCIVVPGATLYAIAPVETQAAENGWVTKGGELYYYKNGKMITAMSLKIGNYYYVFDKKGRMQRNKWYSLGIDRYYLYSDGHAAVNGKKTIGKKDYIFNEYGELMGWHKGEALIIWPKNSDTWYATYNDGSIKKSKWVANGNWYAKSSGIIAQDEFLWIGGNKYYFGKGQAKITNQWKMIDGDWYFFQKNGAVLKDGRKKVRGIWHCFDYAGRELYGWQLTGGKWRYYNSSGYEQHGYAKVQGFYALYGREQNYYFNNDGSTFKGWKGLRYYDGLYGRYESGWEKINGNYYYFSNGTATTGLRISTASQYTYPHYSYSFDSKGKLTSIYKISKDSKGRIKKEKLSISSAYLKAGLYR